MSAPPVASTAKAPIPLWLDWGSRVPWPLLYGFGSALAWIARRVLRYRLKVVRSNVAGAFAALAPRQRRRIERQYYRRLGELAVEVVKSAAMPADELNRRITLHGLEVLRTELDAGRSVLVLAAHQCNWEWLLLALSLKLGHPVDAAYKPLHDPGSERWMHAIRTRFGGTLVPAKELLAHILRERGPRAVAMVADQEPVTSDYKWWTSFLDRSTAFYQGPEKIAEVTRYAVAFASMRRIARGRYEVGFELMFPARASLDPGALTERYARLVEAQIRASPEDWTWSHRRWKLRRPVYANSASAPDRESP
ncbi:MAG: lysophospholipid acyltransferase family protein [Steroidobacteraceae bacterium]